MGESSSGCKKWTAAWTARTANSSAAGDSAPMHDAHASGISSSDRDADSGAVSSSQADRTVNVVDATSGGRKIENTIRSASRRGARNANNTETSSANKGGAKGVVVANQSSSDCDASKSANKNTTQQCSSDNNSTDKSGGGAEATDPSQELSQEGTKLQWWQWRVSLDAELAGAAAELDRVCGAAIKHCMHTASKVAPSGTPTHDSDVLQKAIKDVCGGVATGAPLRLSLDWGMHRVPWETLPSFSERAVFRDFPTLCIGRNMLRSGGVGPAMHGACEVAEVDAACTAYIVDPSGDLPGTRQRFEEWFTGAPGWTGSCGAPALEGDVLRKRLEEKNLFVYLGHGAGVSLAAVFYVVSSACSEPVSRRMSSMHVPHAFSDRGVVYSTKCLNCATGKAVEVVYFPTCASNVYSVLPGST